MERRDDGGAVLTAQEAAEFEDLKHLYASLIRRLGLIQQGRQDGALTVIRTSSTQEVFDEVSRLKDLDD